MKSTRRRTARTRESSETDVIPVLPVWKAFVVQFSRETRAYRATFAGRVEHVSSGRHAGFRSTRELVAALRRMLDQLGERPI